MSVSCKTNKKKSKTKNKKDLEEILFKLPKVVNPLTGTPKEVQKELDKMALYIKENPEDHIKNTEIFDRIHLYMHGFLINVALKQFPYIKGMQTSDIYQEALIALRFKALQGFQMGKGMSFLNFAKMCIRRHLITILNASKTRLKDQSINQAVSLDSPIGNDDGNNHTFASILPDSSDAADKQTELTEAYEVTLKNLCKHLSDFEKDVLHQYLTSSSYTEIANDISEKDEQKHPTKSIDNALVRIRSKAQNLKEISNLEEIPLFMR